MSTSPSSRPRVVLITGACGDIGGALSSAFGDAKPPDKLALCDLLPAADAEPRFASLRDRGVTVFYRQTDVTGAAAVESFVEDAAEALGGIDVCIGNAGIVERGQLIDLAPEAWRRTLDVNLTGCFLIAQAAARAMKRGGTKNGHVVFISSWVQDVPREGIGAYCASKSGLKMLAKCLALELGRDGIRVNLVAPGFVDAGLTGQNLRQNPQRRAGMEESIPLGRLISADELARAVRHFCDDDAAYVTGATLLLDGGASVYHRKPT
jgi:NAD(P)-dependent dehydrogenase (short-subunit alcohol dehydrogenase family)